MGISYSEKLMMAFGHAQITNSELNIVVPNLKAKNFMEKRIKELHLDETGIKYNILIPKQRAEKIKFTVDEVSEDGVI